MKVKVAIITVMLCLTAVLCEASYGQQTKSPIEREGLLRALERRALTEEELILEIENRGVQFRATLTDERKIRKLGKYLGKNGLNNLITAVRNNFNRVETTLLVGRGGTGVTATVQASIAISFGSPTTMLRFYIKNTSDSGTITNIGFLVNPSSDPTWGAKITNPPDLPQAGTAGPGNYTFTNTDLAVTAPGLTGTSAYGFQTNNGQGPEVSKTFNNGFVESGIGPGQASYFSITGDGFSLGSSTTHSIEETIVVRFQGIGDNEQNDIASAANIWQEKTFEATLDRSDSRPFFIPELNIAVKLNQDSNYHHSNIPLLIYVPKRQGKTIDVENLNSFNTNIFSKVLIKKESPFNEPIPQDIALSAWGTMRVWQVGAASEQADGRVLRIPLRFQKIR